jgi:hypothetical protein
VRIPADALARVDDIRGEASRSAWVLGVIMSALTDGEPAAAAATGPLSLAGGIPSPGAVRIHAGCWQRDTARYGDPDDHGGLTLCLAHAHDAVGLKYTRPRKPLPRLAGVS